MTDFNSSAKKYSSNRASYISEKIPIDTHNLQQRIETSESQKENDLRLNSKIMKYI